MTECVEFEIRIDRSDDGNVLDVVITQPDSDVDIRPLAGTALPLTLDLLALDALVDDDEGYGAALTQALFGHKDVRAVFQRASSVAQSLDKPLRVRLNISSAASDLHRLRHFRIRMTEVGHVRAPDGVEVALSSFIDKPTSLSPDNPGIGVVELSIKDAHWPPAMDHGGVTPFERAYAIS